MVTTVVMMFVSFQMNDIYALDEDEIPERMQPSSFIEYISDTEYIILEGGEAIDKSESTPHVDLISNVLDGVIIDDSDYIIEHMPKPVKGMKVTYATDGYILDIIAPNNQEVIYTSTRIVSEKSTSSMTKGVNVKK